jgi:hypothetical protein
MHFKSGEGNLHFYSTNHKKMEYVLPCKVSCGMCQVGLALVICRVFRHE